MIAANYRRHPEALALQLPLPFGHLLRWALPRPGSRILRAIRAQRAALAKLHSRTEYPAPATVPAWFKLSRNAARQLAKIVQSACQPLRFNTNERTEASTPTHSAAPTAAGAAPADAWRESDWPFPASGN